MNNFQRGNAISNAQVGRDFEEVALKYFEQSNIVLNKAVSLPISVNQKKKNHIFDLGNTSIESEKVIVECKSHK